MKYTFDDAYAIEFANEVLVRLDRLLNIEIDHLSTLLRISSASYVNNAKSKMLCSLSARHRCNLSETSCQVQLRFLSAIATMTLSR
jgi:hypothetical protein